MISTIRVYRATVTECAFVAWVDGTSVTSSRLLSVLTCCLLRRDGGTRTAVTHHRCLRHSMRRMRKILLNFQAWDGGCSAIWWRSSIFSLLGGTRPYSLQTGVRRISWQILRSFWRTHKSSQVWNWNTFHYISVGIGTRINHCQVRTASSKTRRFFLYLTN